ncbi:MAG: SOS response-associated peptidase [Curvibacter lanceolatus]|nr:SOS response-associated peptidase [Curvibacter lanceolatus]
MCAHYQALRDPAAWRKNFDVTLPDGGREDVWPSYPAAFIRHPQPLQASGPSPDPAQAEARAEALIGRFGLVPHWAKDETVGRHTYNARSETVASKPSFRDAWRLGRRCVVPAEAIYEPDWRSGRGVPTRIRRSDGQPLALAGVWTGWRSPTGEVLRSFSLLTVNADHHAFMRQFHKPDEEKRMVVVLPPHALQRWLQAPLAEATAWIQACAADVLCVDESSQPPAPSGGQGGTDEGLSLQLPLTKGLLTPISPDALEIQKA